MKEEQQDIRRLKYGGENRKAREVKDPSNKEPLTLKAIASEDCTPGYSSGRTMFVRRALSRKILGV